MNWDYDAIRAFFIIGTIFFTILGLYTAVEEDSPLCILVGFLLVPVFSLLIKFIIFLSYTII